MDENELLDDLYSRVQAALGDVANVVGQTLIPMTFGDVADKVRRGLPDDYPLSGDLLTVHIDGAISDLLGLDDPLEDPTSKSDQGSACRSVDCDRAPGQLQLPYSELMDAAAVGIITGSIGVVGTLAGTGFTQWRSDVREQRRLEVEERREKARLDAETKRERDARLFDHRRIAYTALVTEYMRLYDYAVDVANGEELQPSDDAAAAHWRMVLEVQMLGGAETGAAANTLQDSVNELLWPPAKEWDDVVLEANERLAKFQDAARADLGVPEPKRFKDMEIKVD